MKKMRKAGCLSGLFTCLALLSGVSGCDDAQDIQNWVENTNKLRIAAKQQGGIEPYRQEQFKALKAYFAELNQMALALKNDAKLSERFNNAVSHADLKVTCGKVFLTKPEWQLMVDRCTRNTFFLCAEEVRAYPEMVMAMRGALHVDHQRRFDQTPACRGAL